MQVRSLLSVFVVSFGPVVALLAIALCGRWARPKPSTNPSMSQRLKRVRVDASVVRKGLAERNLTTLTLGVLCGYTDRTCINAFLREGVLPSDIADFCSQTLGMSLVSE